MLKRRICTTFSFLVLCSCLLMADTDPGQDPSSPADAETGINPDAVMVTDDAVPEDSIPVADPPLLLHFTLNGTVCDIQKPKNPVKDPAYKIKAVFPYEIDLVNLVAEFQTEENMLVYIKDVQQISGITPNDFSVPVTYLLKHNGETVQEYKVQIDFKPEFRMDLGINVHPSYNATYGMVNIGYDGDLFIGGKINDFLIGAEITENFYIFNGQSNGNNLSGYWNILRCSFVNSFLLTRNWGLKWGLGGSWINSQFELTSIPRYTRNDPGVFIKLDTFFSPWKYTRINILNEFDLFMNVENGNPFASLENFFPYYKGGAQLIFLDFIEWLQIHFGVSWLYYGYHKDEFTTNMGMVVFETGLHLNLQLPSLFKPPIKNKYLEDEVKVTGAGIETLKTAVKNDIIEFPDIIFKEDADGNYTNELTEESKTVLSQIADILNLKKSMEIIVKIYTKKGDDPVSLLSESVEKLKVIKKHLLDLGIGESRIHIPSEVSILEDKSNTRSLLVKIVVLKE